MRIYLEDFAVEFRFEKCSHSTYVLRYVPNRMDFFFFFQYNLNLFNHISLHGYWRFTYVMYLHVYSNIVIDYEYLMILRRIRFAM